MEEEAKEIKTSFIDKLGKVKDLASLAELEKRYLGRKGKTARILSCLAGLPEKERKKTGREINLARAEIEKLIEEKREKLKEASIKEKLAEERIDVTRPGRKMEAGTLHPLTLVRRKIGEIFQSMGFATVEGPEIESEWYNFDALNIPRDHPARDLQDTLWLKRKRTKEGRKNFLMRTHTSPVQIRYMEKHNPPLRIIVPGRVFRNERTDASHETQFYQGEGLMVDKNISVANFKAVIEEFLKRFFNKDIEIRLRPGYFPFTEPSFEIDAEQEGKWLEMMGAGMVHPNVFKSAGYNPKHWQGFAFGMGVDRLAMMKYKINDIRLFYSGDLRFLKQF